MAVPDSGWMAGQSPDFGSESAAMPDPIRLVKMTKTQTKRTRFLMENLDYQTAIRDVLDCESGHPCLVAGAQGGCERHDRRASRPPVSWRFLVLVEWLLPSNRGEETLPPEESDRDNLTINSDVAADLLEKSTEKFRVGQQAHDSGPGFEDECSAG